MGALTLCLLALATAADAGQPVRPLLDAIRLVESGGDPTPPRGDGGKARGPYQIHRRYWQDAVDHYPALGGTYADVDRREYAECVILCYWHRYAPEALQAGQYDRLARIHNGGPDGDREPETLAYWRRVRKHLPKGGTE